MDKRLLAVRIVSVLGILSVVVYFMSSGGLGLAIGRSGAAFTLRFKGLSAIPRIAGPIVESGLQNTKESSHHRDRDVAVETVPLHTSSEPETVTVLTQSAPQTSSSLIPSSQDKALLNVSSSLPSLPSWKTEASPSDTVVTVTQSSVIATVPSSKGKALLNVSSSLPPLPSWKPGSFCDDFIEHTLQQPIPMCGPKISHEDSVKCFRSKYESGVGVKCYIHNLVNFPRKKIGTWGPLSLLEDPYHCPNPTLDSIKKTADNGHYITGIIKSATQSTPKPLHESSTICDEWINGPTYFLQTEAAHVHIYFRFIVYYNVHQAILDDGAAPGEFVVVRLKNDYGYLFPEFEKALFPELVRFIDLPNVTLCFKKAILVPYTFCSLLFQCKMKANLKPRCFGCNGRGLYGTSLFSFRTRVLKACSLVDLSPEEWENKPQKNIVVVLRRPYQRWKQDRPSNFQRVLANAHELVGSLKKAFPTVNVSAVYMESIPICDQIRYAHSADVLIGVHGAGLVHLWWLQEQGLLLELNPSFQLSNPTFKLLSTLSGRKYYSMTISGSSRSVSVNVNEVVRKLKSVAKLT